MPTKTPKHWIRKRKTKVLWRHVIAQHITFNMKVVSRNSTELDRHTACLVKKELAGTTFGRLNPAFEKIMIRNTKH